MRLAAPLAALTAGLVLTVCAGCGDSLGDPPEARTAGDDTGLPPPAGSRWVGIGDVVVAVPELWGTQTQPCAEPDGDTVFLAGRSSTRLDCATVPTAGVSSLTVATVASGAVDLEKSADLGAEVDGLRVSHSGTTCRTPTTCELTFVVPDSGAAFHVVHSGRRSRAFVDGVLASLTRLPADQTTVPLVEYGISVARAEKLLAAAGLVAVAPDLDFPHYATGTTPPAGTVVARGQAVELTIGDG